MRQRDASCRILRISVNGGSTIFGFTFWVIHVPNGYRHQFVRYGQPLLGKTTETCSLLHPENERQQSDKESKPRILGDLSSDWLQRSIYQIMAAFTGKNYSGMLPATL